MPPEVTSEINRNGNHPGFPDGAIGTRPRRRLDVSSSEVRLDFWGYHGPPTSRREVPLRLRDFVPSPPPPCRDTHTGYGDSTSEILAVELQYT